MEKRKILWTFLTAIVISLIIIIGSLSFSTQQKKTYATEENTTEETSGEPGYIMRIDNGQVSVFRSGSNQPYQRLDIPLNLLSDYDRVRLEEGIEVETEQEMRQLIEDFTS